MRVLELAREFPPCSPLRRPQLGARPRVLLSAVLAGSVLCVAPPVFAQNKAAADVLFQAARTAMAAQDYDEACLKFDESNRADRAVGTVLNLGNCEELRGRYASSWERYIDAMSMMTPADRRFAFAKAKAEELEAKVPRLVIELDSTAPSGTLVEVNGNLLTKPGQSLRLNPGNYAVAVRAPGYEEVSYSVELDVGTTESLTVNVGPPLAPEKTHSAGRTEVPVVIHVKDESSQRTLCWVTGAVGGAGILAGGVLGALTLSRYSVVKQHCNLDSSSQDKIPCDNSEGTDAGKTGKILGWTSIGAGALGLVGAGLFLYFTFGPEDTQTARLSINPGSTPSINLTLPLSL
jgi:PEGA domain